MEETERIWEVVASLASTLEKTRYEIDGLRTVFMGVLVSLSRDAHSREALSQTIAHAIERDAALSLNSNMKDDALQHREDWMRRLIPEDLWPRVQQIRGQAPHKP